LIDGRCDAIAGSKSRVEVEHRQVDTDRMPVHVAQDGRDQPALLMHGWPVALAPVCRHCSPPTARACPDLRGAPWSDDATNPA
jgi:hypothetical protein